MILKKGCVNVNIQFRCRIQIVKNSLDRNLMPKCMNYENHHYLLFINVNYYVGIGE